MATVKLSDLAKEAGNLAAQLALVESRAREESRGREKSDSRPSSRPSTAVSASGDSVKDSMNPTCWVARQTTTGHTSPINLDNSSHGSWRNSKRTTGNTSPAKLEGSGPRSYANSKFTTGYTSPLKLEDSIPRSWATSKASTGRTSPTNLVDSEEANTETASQEPAEAQSIIEEDGNLLSLAGGSVAEEIPSGRKSTEAEVLCHSVAEAVEAFEAKLTRTKKLKEISQTRNWRTFGWKRLLTLGLTLVGVFALIFTYHYISECIIIIKVKQLEPFAAQ